MATTEELELACKTYIQQQMPTDSAHDLAHIKRVVATARQLARTEGEAELPVVLAAWLHDLVNLPKDHPQRASASQMAADQAIEFLKTLAIPDPILELVHHAIEAHSFSAEITIQNRVAQIVQDADRLDALGAIGIARCLMVGGALNRKLYADVDPFCEKRSPDDQQFTLDHFYTKLFQIVETLGTASARIEGQRRAQFMSTYLRQLANELDGRCFQEE